MHLFFYPQIGWFEWDHLGLTRFVNDDQCLLLQFLSAQRLASFSLGLSYQLGVCLRQEKQSCLNGLEIQMVSSTSGPGVQEWPVTLYLTNLVPTWFPTHRKHLKVLAESMRLGQILSSEIN